MSEFTQILERVDRGDPEAAAGFSPIVYEELRRLAAQKMAREAAGHTLQPTALVHEAWMRLVGGDAPTFHNRAHFFGAAAEAMRRILVEHARRRLAAKRGAGVQVIDLDGLDLPSPVAADVAEASRTAKAAQSAWAALPPKARGDVLRKFASLCERHVEEISRWIVRGTGSIPPKGPFEVMTSAREAIEIAALTGQPVGHMNDTEYGLVASIFTADQARAMRVAAQLKTGIVHINDQTINHEVFGPIGGMGASGNGARSGGPSIMDEYSQWQWITVNEKVPAYPF
ncbi:MAG: aldehyde dehydrogenase family protein [Verrucomicrobiae bacterium]|nr:aldehyde dehydrogenase family protein [Verrucomicrobiae bacterium]